MAFIAGCVTLRWAHVCADAAGGSCTSDLCCAGAARSGTKLGYGLSFGGALRAQAVASQHWGCPVVQGIPLSSGSRRKSLVSGKCSLSPALRCPSCAGPSCHPPACPHEGRVPLRGCHGHVSWGPREGKVVFVHLFPFNSSKCRGGLLMKC